MDHASRKLYYRKVTVTGLKGCYRAVAATINRSVDDMAERDRVLAEVEQTSPIWSKRHRAAISPARFSPLTAPWPGCAMASTN